jgi:hypothetical protein
MWLLRLPVHAMWACEITRLAFLPFILDIGNLMYFTSLVILLL